MSYVVPYLYTEVGYLTHLLFFDFATLDLTGYIPTQVGKLQYLTGLFFSRTNDLTGSVPSEIGHLS